MTIKSVGLFGILLWALASASASALAFDHQHSRWDSLLQQHVYWINNQLASEVDYQAFSQPATKRELDVYLDELSAVSLREFQQFTDAQQQAFLINAYNAFTIELVLTEYPNLESIKQLGSLFKSPWKQDFISLFGAQRSLDDIEHGMLRKDFNEPRIHFAVNCASVGCPALFDRAFTANNLEQMLEEGMRRFMSDRSRNYFDPDSQTLYVSKIFDWFGEDFAPSVSFSVSRFSEELGGERAAVQRARVKFLPYDWSLNSR